MAGKRILLVEGTDDEHVMKHLCGNRNLPELDEIKPQQGVEALVKNLPVRLKESDIEALGVMVDADADLAARWRSLRKPLSGAGYADVPDMPGPEGTILEPPADTLLPRVGVWIMPDNRLNGILEDFLRFLVPPDSHLLEHVESCVSSIPAAERRFTDKDLPKAVIHTWLAWQEEPGKPLGLAITHRYLDPGVAQVDILVSWLKRLFFEPASGARDS